MPLRCLRPRIASADLRSVTRPLQTDAERQAAWDARTKSARAVYQTPEWRAARKGFLAAHPVCACGCGRAANTVDHIRPHKGDMALFWDRSNWQPLCFVCHQAKRGRERAQAVRAARSS